MEGTCQNQKIVHSLGGLQWVVELCLVELGNFVLISRKKQECGKQRKGRELLTERNAPSSRNVREHGAMSVEVGELKVCDLSIRHSAQILFIYKNKNRKKKLGQEGRGRGEGDSNQYLGTISVHLQSSLLKGARWRLRCTSGYVAPLLHAQC